MGETMQAQIDKANEKQKITIDEICRGVAEKGFEWRFSANRVRWIDNAGKIKSSANRLAENILSPYGYFRRVS